jgi:hypothetical protein
MSIYQRLQISILVSLLSAVTTWAVVTGSITGVVVDPTGALIPNAEVEVVNVATGISQTVHTDALGSYSFLALPVGQYRLEVKATGFASYRQTEITLNATDELRIDVRLNVGQITQQVEVTTSAVHVETDNTQLGDVIKSESIAALPLNGRAFTDLLGLQPGVIPALSGGLMNFFGSTEQGNVSITGHRESANGFLLNGSSVNNALNNGTTVLPNLDSIAEFKVLTANFDAEYGNYSWGLVTVVTKSGTNEWHGSAFDFLRNTSLDARNFYDIDRGAFQQNQFGGTLGSPIKRNKVFLFLDYQGTRSNQGTSSGIVPVPSAAERTGDFSAIADTALTGTVNGPYFASLLSQKLGYPVSSGEPYYLPGCTAAAQCVFPNGIIPQQAFAAPVSKLMQFISPPNVGPNYVSTGNTIHTRDDMAGARLDVNSQRLGMLTAYYFVDDSFSIIPFGGNVLPGFPTMTGGRSQLITLGDTKSFGATALNELHLSFNRYVFHNNTPIVKTPTPLSSFGFPEGVPGAITAVAPAYSGVPWVNLNSYGFGVYPNTYNRAIGTTSVLDNFAKVIGTHAIKFGGQYVFNDFHQPFPLLGGDGAFWFTGVETGSDFADFLIGTPSGFFQGSGFDNDNRRNYLGFYGQDSWRARPNFTLNYGLRYEIFQPWYERHDQISTMILGEQSTVYPGAPQGYVFPGDLMPGGGKIPRTIAPTPLNNFAPRLGFAYSPSGSNGAVKWLTGGPGKFSIRGGFGMFYTNTEGVTMLDHTGLAPWAYFYSPPTPPLFDTPYRSRTDGTIRTNPFPFTPPPPGSTDIDWPHFLPIAGYPEPAVDNRTSYSEDYNLTLQRQFSNNTLLTLGYVGSQGHRLLTGLENNPGNPELCLSLSQPNDVAPGTATCGPFGEGGVYTRADGTIVNGTRGPFPSSFGGNGYMANIANSNYNALEVSVRHTTRPLTFFASYTYGKSMDNASSLGGSLYSFNQRKAKGLSAFDMTHNFVISYDYMLPFERLTGNHGARWVGGWHLIGITRFATGFPIALSEGDDRSLLGNSGVTGGGADTPNFLGGDLSFTNPRSGKPYFNTALFTVGALGKMGTADRAFFHGPGFNNFDLSLHKEFRLTESKILQFRAEFFNGFNHAQFLNPSGNITGNFGVVTNASAPRIGQVALKFLF